MADRDHRTGSDDFPPAYPRAGHEGVPDRTGWRKWAPRLLLPLVVLLLAGAVVGSAVFVLHAVDPMGDEWVCSEGEVPAGSDCYPEDEPLPPGVTADPLGNRPMPYNCDKDGWTPIENEARDERDCLNDELPMPDGWQVAD
jgi:hypothetical protein